MTDSKKHTAVIAGAGIAGLTAAIELAQAGVGVTLLEGDRRIGGRIKTATVNDHAVDLGGMWFHSPQKNKFFEWLNTRYGPLPHGTDTVEHRLAVTQDGVYGPAFRDQLKTFEAAWEAYERDHPGEDLTLEDLQRRINTPQSEEFARCMAVSVMAAEHPSEISCRDYFDDPFGSGGHLLNAGNAWFIDKMAKEARGLGVEILTGKPVCVVTRTDEGVRLRTVAGEEFDADRGIVTASLGVLKDGHILFDKLLEGAINPRLEGLSFKNAAKIIVPVKQAFFEARGIQDNTRIDVMTGKEPLLMMARPNGANAVLFYAGGKTRAERIEFWAGQGSDVAHDAFNRVAGVFSGIGKYIDGNITVTDWGRNRFTRGAYSGAKPGHTRQGVADAGRVLLAGEAWVKSENGPGSMNGAWVSGREAADITLKRMGLSPA